MVLAILDKEDLEKIFDDNAKKVINYFIDKAIEFQPELLMEQEERPIQIPKEHIEQWIVQALDADPVGAGNYPVDVIKDDQFAADIKMLSCKVNKNGEVKNSLSGEASLGQKFADDEESLDELFRLGEKEKIINKWKDILNSKYQNIYDTVHTIYYIFLLRAGFKFYLCGCRLELDEINNISPEKMTKNTVFVNGFIETKYGEVKIYKAKKRMELRLHPKAWVEDEKTIEFETDKRIIHKNLRGTL